MVMVVNKIPIQQRIYNRSTIIFIWFKEAKGGIYSAIGNGLREHPEWWVNEPKEGISAVITGKSAYIDVSNKEPKDLS